MRLETRITAGLLSWAQEARTESKPRHGASSPAWKPFEIPARAQRRGRLLPGHCLEQTLHPAAGIGNCPSRRRNLLPALITPDGRSGRSHLRPGASAMTVPTGQVTVSTGHRCER
jgi:hypothetical protein